MRSLNTMSPIQFGLLTGLSCTLSVIGAIFVFNMMGADVGSYWSSIGGLIGGFPTGYCIQKRYLANKN